MKTSELKKGTRVLLAYGGQHDNIASAGPTLADYEKALLTAPSYTAWEADLLDSARGNIRFANVFGFYTEMGSLYAHDIIAYKDEKGKWQPVEHTKSQNELREQVRKAMTS